MGQEPVRAVDRIDGYVRASAPTARAGELNRLLSQQGVFVSELTPWETELESVFLDLTGEEIA